jgi:hypothetical protein
MQLCDAKQKLISSSLSTGALIFDSPVKDSCKTYIYKQSPEGSAVNTVSIGTSIDLYLTNDKSKVKTPKDDADEEP